MFPSEPNSPVEKSNIIQATLIFELPIELAQIPDEMIEEEKPQPVEPEKTPPIIETPADSQIETIPKPEVQAKQEEVIQQEPEQNALANEVSPTEQTNAPVSITDIRAPATSMARRHLNSFQQQQQNKVAEQASRYYQQHKNSPVIDNEVLDPFITEDERLRDSLKVRADCSSAGKQTTAVLLGFLGAQIDCSKPPPINGFIQDRINKQSHLPGQYRQEDKERLKSIVIKKQP